MQTGGILGCEKLCIWCDHWDVITVFFLFSTSAFASQAILVDPNTVYTMVYHWSFNTLSWKMVITVWKSNACFWWTDKVRHHISHNFIFTLIMWSWYRAWHHILHYTWWRHQMELFSALLALCVSNSPVTGEFPAQRPVTRSFDVFFDLRLE